MKNIFKPIAIVIAAAAFCSCDEFGPVFTGKYDEPADERIYTDADFAAQTRITIKELKAMYKDGPVKITDDLVIKGQVTTSDASGNFYKSFYIQDETAGIELKLGLTGLYNDYKLGQWIYVKCKGLVVGDYEGSRQLGYEDITGDYETAYMEVKLIIENHVFKGALDEPLQPEVISEADLTTDEHMGKYVTINGLSYTNTIFCLVYVNPDGNTKLTSNRIFLDEENKTAWGVTTWAMSKSKFTEYLYSGVFDTADIGNGPEKVKDHKFEIKPTAYTVSQYFKMGKTSIAVRTSGYCKFADKEMSETIGNGTSVSFTGILTNYRGEPQFTLIDLDGVSAAK